MPGDENQPKTRVQMEAEFLEVVRQCQHEWNVATDEYREAAREIYMAALFAFNALVAYGEPPSTGQQKRAIVSECNHPEVFPARLVRKEGADCQIPPEAPQPWLQSQ